jgi:hypothetical protein
MISDPTVIETPLGTVRFGLSVDGVALEREPPQETYRFPGGGWAVSWRSTFVEVELLVCRPVFSPPLYMPIIDCWGILWRCRAKESTGPLILTAAWEEGYHWQEGGPDGGQFLYAKTWDDGKVKVTIGTQDDAMLERRAQRSDYLPSEWEEYFVDSHRYTSHDIDRYWFLHPIHEKLKDSGVPSPLPGLKTGQEFQIPFGVAWDNLNKESCATSLAVEASPEQILAGCGCY